MCGLQNGSKTHRAAQQSRSDGIFLCGSDSEIVAPPVYQVVLYLLPTVRPTVNSIAVETTLSLSKLLVKSPSPSCFLLQAEAAYIKTHRWQHLSFRKYWGPDFLHKHFHQHRNATLSSLCRDVNNYMWHMALNCSYLWICWEIPRELHPPAVFPVAQCRMEPGTSSAAVVAVLAPITLGCCSSLSCICLPEIIQH